MGYKSSFSSKKKNFYYSFVCLRCGAFDSARFLKRRCKGTVFLDKCENPSCSVDGSFYTYHKILGWG